MIGPGWRLIMRLPPGSQLRRRTLKFAAGVPLLLGVASVAIAFGVFRSSLKASKNGRYASVVSRFPLSGTLALKVCRREIASNNLARVQSIGWR